MSNNSLPVLVSDVAHLDKPRMVWASFLKADVDSLALLKIFLGGFDGLDDGLVRVGPPEACSPFLLGLNWAPFKREVLLALNKRMPFRKNKYARRVHLIIHISGEMFEFWSDPIPFGLFDSEGFWPLFENSLPANANIGSALFNFYFWDSKGFSKR